ncbi:MAG: GIY-YIG nuclease family protein [bacterium]
MESNTHIIYILTNEAMPDIIKIGKTERPIEQRMRDLYTSGVPVPFECFHASVVDRSKNVESRLHSAFEKYRVNKNREFFEINPESVLEILEMVELQDVTPNVDVVETVEDTKAMTRLEQRAERFSFKMVGIPIQAMLTFLKDDSITCTVLENNKVLFQGKESSLSGAALDVLHNLGHHWKSAQGAAYWQYEGKTLKDIREQMENE